MGNPEPIFVDREVTIIRKSKMGQKGQHLKLSLSPGFEAVWFGAKPPQGLEKGKAVALAYTPQIEEWNGKKTIRIRVRDLKI